jgi:hypothetical protein
VRLPAGANGRFVERYVVLSVAVPSVIAPQRNAICERVVKPPKQAGRQPLRYYPGAIPRAPGQFPDGRRFGQGWQVRPRIIRGMSILLR